MDRDTPKAFTEAPNKPSKLKIFWETLAINALIAVTIAFIIRPFVETGMSSFPKDQKLSLAEQYPNETPLMLAVREGLADKARELIDSGADVNAGNPDGNTALVLVAAAGSLELTELLLQAGADVDTVNQHEWTAPMAAAVKGHAAAVQALLDAGAKPEPDPKAGKVTALMLAVAGGNADVVKALLAAGGDANAWSNGNNAWSLLLEAALNAYPDVVNVLLAGGADVNARSAFGETPLMAASGKYPSMFVQSLTEAGVLPMENIVALATKDMVRVNITKALIAAGADVNAQSHHGETALMLAASRGLTPIVRLLTAAHADVNIQNNEGNTALDMTKNEAIKNLLIQAGARSGTVP